MKTYRVSWIIEIDAKNETEAAKECLNIQRDPFSEALVFEVKCLNDNSNYQIDLENDLD